MSGARELPTKQKDERAEKVHGRADAKCGDGQAGNRGKMMRERHTVLHINRKGVLVQVQHDGEVIQTGGYKDVEQVPECNPIDLFDSELR